MRGSVRGLIRDLMRGIIVGPMRGPMNGVMDVPLSRRPSIVGRFHILMPMPKGPRTA